MSSSKSDHLPQYKISHLSTSDHASADARADDTAVSVSFTDTAVVVLRRDDDARRSRLEGAAASRRSLLGRRRRLVPRDRARAGDPGGVPQPGQRGTRRRFPGGRGPATRCAFLRASGTTSSRSVTSARTRDGAREADAERARARAELEDVDGSRGGVFVVEGRARSEGRRERVRSAVRAAPTTPASRRRSGSTAKAWRNRRGPRSPTTPPRRAGRRDPSRSRSAGDIARSPGPPARAGPGARGARARAGWRRGDRRERNARTLERRR